MAPDPQQMQLKPTESHLPHLRVTCYQSVMDRQKAGAGHIPICLSHGVLNTPLTSIPPGANSTLHSPKLPPIRGRVDNSQVGRGDRLHGPSLSLSYKHPNTEPLVDSLRGVWPKPIHLLPDSVTKVLGGPGGPPPTSHQVRIGLPRPH